MFGKTGTLFALLFPIHSLIYDEHQLMGISRKREFSTRNEAKRNEMVEKLSCPAQGLIS